MTLRDHFHPPLSTYRHWQGFHSAWATEMVRLLDDLLPERYFAEPNVKVGTNVEIDVATFEQAVHSTNGGSAVATQIWAPPRPPLSAPLDLGGETFEVQILNDEEGPRLVAAIELVSPGNKDRPATRQAFCAKCASYLQDGISVVIVDLVTSRSGNLFDELLTELRLTGIRAWSSPTELYAVACRSVSTVDDSRLEAWPHALALGAVLPTLPLWLSPELALPVDLQTSYEATCRLLRISGA